MTQKDGRVEEGKKWAKISQRKDPVPKLKHHMSRCRQNGRRFERKSEGNFVSTHAKLGVKVGANY